MGTVLITTLGVSFFVFALITVAVYRRVKQSTERLESINFKQLVNSTDSIPITLLVPLFNEEENCTENIVRLMNQQYRDLKILVINDGSTDSTMDKLSQHFQLIEAHRPALAKLRCAPVKRVLTSNSYPNLTIIDTIHSGKADSLNAGLNYCHSPLFCAIDANTTLDSTAIINLALPFIEDRTTIAVNGPVGINNGCEVQERRRPGKNMPRNFLAQIQMLENVHSLILGYLDRNTVRSIFIKPGAFSLYRRDLVVEVGGFNLQPSDETMELVLRLHKFCKDAATLYKISYIHQTLAWAKCPESWLMLGQQRSRRQQELMETILAHGQMFLNPKYGSLGMLVLPSLAIFEITRPILETLGYLCLTIALIAGWLSPSMAGIVLGFAVLIGTALSIASVSLLDHTFNRYHSWRNFSKLM